MPGVIRLAALILALLVTGCVTTTTMPTYVVEFSLTNTSGLTMGASEYPHCGTSEVRPGHLLVQAPKPQGRALLHVDPEFASGYAVLGSEGKAFSLDREVRVPDGVDGTDAAIVAIAWRDGVLLVNGVAQPLPYAGSSTSPGLWNATYTIRDGPGKVKVDHRSYSCA